MVYNECNLWAGIYKVQTFGTTHFSKFPETLKYNLICIKSNFVYYGRMA